MSAGKCICVLFLFTVCTCTCTEEFRLVGGPNDSEGRLEVLHDGVWGTVCDDYFRDHEAAVFCRFLGMPGDSEEINHAYGPGTGQIWLDSLHNSSCPNSWVTNLNDCSFLDWGVHNCHHNADQSIKCTPFNDALNDPGNEGDFRLTGGPSDNEGRLEVHHDGQWGTVCKHYFNDHAARVVCSEMGYDGPGIDLDTEYASDGSGEIFLDDIRCTASDSTFADCTHRPWREHNCKHAYDVGVRCVIPCEPGHFGVEGVTPCSPCAIGSYQPDDGEDSCADCPEGETTANEGSTASSACYPVGSGTMDPHFMITDALSKKHLCFDYMGHDGDYIQLVEDSENGISVHGKLFAPSQDNPEHTYFSEIIVITQNTLVTFNTTDILVDEESLGWDFDDTYTDSDVVLRVSTSRDNGRHITVTLETLNGRVSIFTQRNIHDDLSYLGVYVGAVDGFSVETQGIIGQFINRHFEILEEDNGLFAKVSFDGGDVLVPVHRHSRYSPATKKSEPCYLYKHYNGHHAFIQQQYLL